MLHVADAHSKAAQRRGHVDIVECAAHRVLTADGGQFQPHLGMIGTQ